MTAIASKAPGFFVVSNWIDKVSTGSYSLEHCLRLRFPALVTAPHSRYVRILPQYVMSYLNGAVCDIPDPALKCQLKGRTSNLTCSSGDCGIFMQICKTAMGLTSTCLCLGTAADIPEQRGVSRTW